MSKATCPNCGAPVTGAECKYCGTVHEMPAGAMAVGKVASLSFEHDGVLYEMDVRIDGFSLDDRGSTETYHDLSGRFMSFHVPMWRLRFEGDLVPSRKHGREGLWFSRELFPEEVTA